MCSTFFLRSTQSPSIFGQVSAYKLPTLLTRQTSTPLDSGVRSTTDASTGATSLFFAPAIQILVLVKRVRPKDLKTRSSRVQTPALASSNLNL